MSIVVAIMLSVVYLTPLVILWCKRRDGSRDLLAPINVVAGLHLFTTVPFLFLMGVNEEFLTPLVRQHPSVRDLDLTIVSYGLLQALAFTALVLGLASPVGRTVAHSLPLVGGHFTPLRYCQALVVALIVGLGSLVLFFREIGGYEVMLDNLGRRTQLSAGFGYLLCLSFLLAFAVVLVIYSMRDNRSLGKYLLVTTLFLLHAAMTSSLGGRYKVIQLIVLALLTWHYGVKPFWKVSWRAVVLFFLVIPYMVGMPLIRSEGGIDRFSKDPGSLIAEVAANLDQFVLETSYVHHYLLIVSHFDPTNIWMGASYRDLLVAPVPSSLMPDKPPVDDGVYLRTIAEGHAVVPGTAFRRLYASSWPLETFGAMYANFWAPGVVLGMFLLGVVYNTAYRYMQRSRYTLYSILLYGLILSQFHLSNLRIVQVGINLLIATLFFAVFFGIRFAGRSTRTNERLFATHQLDQKRAEGQNDESGHCASRCGQAISPHAERGAGGFMTSVPGGSHE